MLAEIITLWVFEMKLNKLGKKLYSMLSYQLPLVENGAFQASFKIRLPPNAQFWAWVQFFIQPIVCSLVNFSPRSTKVWFRFVSMTHIGHLSLNCLDNAEKNFQQLLRDNFQILSKFIYNNYLFHIDFRTKCITL